MMFKSYLQYLLVSIASVGVLVGAAPAALPEDPATRLDKRAVTPVPAATINSFTPYTYFAGAVACDPSTTANWSCPKCSRLPGFKVVATGGDGAATQYWFVGYYPTLQSVIVAHQGTDADKIIPVLTNINIAQRSFPTSLFPGMPSNVKVHDGFADAQARAAPSILTAVRTAIAQNAATKVVTVGHSLGGAQALISAIFLERNLPSNIAISSVTYGAPRVGNADFANWVDNSRIDFTRIGNQDDPVLILPGRFLGFRHASGEIHIRDDNVWVACTGQENESAGCLVKDVGNLLIADAGDHDGPYNGINMGCSL